MKLKTNEKHSSMRYQADEKPSLFLSFGLGLQIAILIASGVVLTPAIVVNAAGGTEEFKEWAVFAAVTICGITTVLQAVKIGRVGTGYILAMRTSGAFIAVSATAIAQGGPAMLGTLVAISALFQFAIATRLSLFRRIITPTVAGIVIMLISVTVMPILFDMLISVPEGTGSFEAPVSAIITFLVIIVVAFKARKVLRLWSPVIGVVIGSLVGIYFGIYNVEIVKEAAWIGLPEAKWPGLDLSFSPVFWSLLPAFILLTLVGATKTIGDSVAIQRVSWRDKRAIDFRQVQGAVAADGVGNLLSGIAGTVPNTTYSSSVAVVELTGVASRRVGIALGCILFFAAFCPKLLALILAIPEPVVASFATILIAMLFVLGIKIIIEDGMDFRKGLIVGSSFWIGVGFQNGLIFPDQISPLFKIFLGNGMTSGAMVAIAMTVFLELSEPKRHKIQIPLLITELPRLKEFIQNFSSKYGWDEAMTERLYSITEETISSLIHEKKNFSETDSQRDLLLTAKRDGDNANLEFIVASAGSNLEDQIMVMSEKPTDGPSEKEISLRLLRHLASSVNHQQYYNTDIVTVRVEETS